MSQAFDNGKPACVGPRARERGNDPTLSGLGSVVPSAQDFDPATEGETRSPWRVGTWPSEAYVSSMEFVAEFVTAGPNKEKIVRHIAKPGGPRGRTMCGRDIPSEARWTNERANRASGSQLCAKCVERGAAQMS